MIDAPKLRGLIAEKGFSQAQVARMLGITSQTFYDKMASGNFWLGEAEQMIDLLQIENPADIFFADRSA